MKWEVFQELIKNINNLYLMSTGLITVINTLALSLVIIRYSENPEQIVSAVRTIILLYAVITSLWVFSIFKAKKGGVE